MIKIRNKRIALLLVLAMLSSLFIGVGTASAATNFTDVNSTYTYVEADDQQLSGTIGISNTGKWTNVLQYMATTPDTITVEVTLPDGVTFSDDQVDDNNNALTNTGDFGDDTYTEDFPFSTSFSTTLDQFALDIDSDVTGSIVASVKVSGTLDGDTVFEESAESVTIAKISDGDLTVSSASKKTVTVGSDQVGGKITVKENSPDSLTDSGSEATQVKFTITTSGVTWVDDVYDTIATDPDRAYDDQNCEFDYNSDSTDKTIYLDCSDDDANTISKLIFKPVFKVAPSATGDVTVKVAGDGITTESFVVATIGAGGAAVTVDSNDGVVYRGQEKCLDEVDVNVDPVSDLDQDDYFTVTLPKGLEFVDNSETDSDWSPIDEPSGIEFEGLYDSNRTAWFTVTDANGVDSDFDLENWYVIADNDATVGDLNATFAGAFDGSVKIATVASPFTVSTTPFNIQSGLTSVTGSDIVITEAADGALAVTNSDSDGFGQWGYDIDGTYPDEEDYALDIELPSGVTFNGTPDVDVTSGDLEIDDVSLVDNDTLRIEIDTASNVASTITISNIQYSVLNQGSVGNLTARVGGLYNIASSNPLESLTIGTVASNPAAVYVIGASTFTVNGVTNTVVTPSYVKNDRTYLAIRDIATGLGIDSMNVLWDEVGQKVTLVKGDKVVQVAIGSTTMYVNGVAVAMDVAPEISNDRAMLPAAFIAQAFGATASWDAATSTVTIK